MNEIPRWKTKAIELLPKIIDKLQQLQIKLDSNHPKEIDYSSLSPIDNGDKGGHYSRALEWALTKRKEKDIKNIALTGPYGSGKSTILKTFQKNYKGKELKFLNISLATFKEEKPKVDENGFKVEKNKDELLRLIEISILQQIFYHEEDKDIPDSRFKKIKSYGWKKLLFSSILILIFLISLFNFLNPYLIQSIFKDKPFGILTCNVLHYGSVIVLLVGIGFIIYKSIRLISSITINKLQFQNAEIGIGENLNKSILNHHLDEILYFFTIRPYNVVIIEDLDRFQETEIFTKLREINLLLNNSKKTKNKHIVFIYAVRDEMFLDNERIKFFDFLIPVIPVINSSNSNEILLKKKQDYNYNLTNTFIEDISFFIDDMRLLHNITNEFYLYKNQHGDAPISEDKLFAVITYKNIYPNDFVDLSKNEGYLFEVLNSKSDYIHHQIDLINDELIDLNEQMEIIESIQIKNINELRLLYILRTIEGLQSFHLFLINNKPTSIDDLLKDENFEYLKTNQINYQSKIYNTYNRRNDIKNEVVNSQFNKIEKKVDPKRTYNERVKEISDYHNGKLDLLKNKVQDLERKKDMVRNLSLSALLQSDVNILLPENENFDLEFIRLLVRNGYVAEDYLDYISLFHEGSITRNDHKFIISLRNKQKLGFEFKLAKTEKLIEKINSHDFNSDYILNYNLIDFLLSKPKKYKSQLEYLFIKLGDESIDSIRFIDEFIFKTQNQRYFIKELSSSWNNIWAFYNVNTSYDKGFKSNILKLILEFGELNSLTKISENSELENHLLSDPSILKIIQDKEKLKRIIEKLNLKFYDLDFKNSPDELLKYIYENNYYNLNDKIVPKFIKKYGDFKQVSFDTTNYAAIKNSKCEKLIDYVDDSIGLYVENIYLKLDDNTNEEQNELLELINHPDLDERMKEDIIKKVSTKIKDIKKVESNQLLEQIYNNNKLEPTWRNILYYFEIEENQFPEALVNFLNENAKFLSKTKMESEVGGKNIYGEFCKALIYLKGIETESYLFLTKSIPWWYEDLELKNLDAEEMSILIVNRVVKPTIKSFNALKDNYDVLHIELLENHKKTFSDKIDELSLNSYDLELILISNKFNNKEKNQFLDSCNDETIKANSENLKLLADIYLKDRTFSVRESLFKEIVLSNAVTVVNRIKIFNQNLFPIDSVFIEKFLQNLDGKYSKIIDKTKKAKLTDNPENRELLENLESKGYISSFSTGLFGLRVNHKRR